MIFEIFNVIVSEILNRRTQISKPRRLIEIKISVEYRKAILSAKMNPKVVAQKFKELGNDAYRKKDYAKALKNYAKAIELEPNEIAFYNNSAAAYLEMKNYDECIKFCQQACEIGKKNRAELKFIFKGFRRMGQAYEEMGNPKMAKVVFEEAKVFVEKAQKKNDKSDCEKFLSEIEVAMERCQIKEVSQRSKISKKNFFSSRARGPYLLLQYFSIGSLQSH